MGKLIVIEGTDCSGKETQTNKIVERLKNDGKKVIRFSFPMYDTPTGKVVGGPYLGKKEITDSWFDDPISLDPKVSCLYYAADRKYNMAKIYKYLNEDYIVFLDRYVTSNMAHQGSKLNDLNKRKELFSWIEKLEYDLLELPRPDLTLFLHMPYEYANKLKNNRNSIDKHESSPEHLINAENTYLELAKIYNYKTIECVSNNKIKSIDSINDEIYDVIRGYFNEARS